MRLYIDGNYEGDVIEYHQSRRERGKTMTREQRKKELKSNMHVSISVLMYMYLILAFWVRLLS